MLFYQCKECDYTDRYPYSDSYDSYCRKCGHNEFNTIRKKTEWYLVSVYLCDLSYGGPEEGGWWYDTGSPIERANRFLKTFKDKEEALAYRDRLQRALDIVWNSGRYPISSVLSQGIYKARCHEEEMPAPYPSNRPQYC